MEQPSNQQQRECGGGYTMGESSCHAADLDQAAMTAAPYEVDSGALLMELMDQDVPSSDLLLNGDVDRQLIHVIRSLEVEISGDQQSAAAAMMTADEGVESLDRIDDEDVLSDDYEGASSFFGHWPQVPSSSCLLLAGGYEAEGWCVYTDNNNGYEESGGVVLGYDHTMVDHQCCYCCAEGSADHMYLPLWE